MNMKNERCEKCGGLVHGGFCGCHPAPATISEKRIGETIIRYDDNNFVTYFQDSSGYEYWQRCDNDGNLLWYKNSKGREYGQSKEKGLQK